MPKQKDKPKVKPVREFRIGRIKAAIWANDTDSGIRHNVTFSRLYRLDGGEWQDSTSFGRDDLPLLMKVADRVHSFIYEQSSPQNGSQNHEQDGSSTEESSAENEETHF
ncbi:MAG: hypothetical protein WAU84_01470 [Thermoguttaceae bacterium]